MEGQSQPTAQPSGMSTRSRTNTLTNRVLTRIINQNNNRAHSTLSESTPSTNRVTMRHQSQSHSPIRNTPLSPSHNFRSPIHSVSDVLTHDELLQQHDFFRAAMANLEYMMKLENCELSQFDQQLNAAVESMGILSHNITYGEIEADIRVEISEHIHQFQSRLTLFKDKLNTLSHTHEVVGNVSESYFEDPFPNPKQVESDSNTLEIHKLREELETLRTRVDGAEYNELLIDIKYVSSQYEIMKQALDKSSEQLMNKVDSFDFKLLELERKLETQGVYQLQERIERVEKRLDQSVSDNATKDAIDKTVFIPSDPSLLQEGDQVAKLEKSVRLMTSQIATLTAQSQGANKKMKDLQKEILSVSQCNQTVASTEKDIPSKRNLNFSRVKLDDLIQWIQQLISKPIPENSDPAIVKKAFETISPRVRDSIKDAEKELATLLKTDDFKDSDYTTALDTIKSANTWLCNVNELYISKDIHSIDKLQGKPLKKVVTFNADHSKSVYEFLEEFETAYLHVPGSKHRANIMTNELFPDWLKTQTARYANDYNELRKWLLARYGDGTEIVNSLVGNLISNKKDKLADTSQRVSFQHN